MGFNPGLDSLLVIGRVTLSSFPFIVCLWESHSSPLSEPQCSSQGNGNLFLFPGLLKFVVVVVVFVSCRSNGHCIVGLKTK